MSWCDDHVCDYPCGDDAFDDDACAGDDYDAFDDDEVFKRGWNEADTWLGTFASSDVDDGDDADSEDGEDDDDEEDALFSLVSIVENTRTTF